MEASRNLESRVSAKAPASIGNLAVGFDVLGVAFPLLWDEVTVARRIDDRVVIQEIIGSGLSLPRRAESNTASRALLAMRADVSSLGGFDLWIRKGIPLSAGLGGSAASAVAAVVAAVELTGLQASVDDLLSWSAQGEEAASGVAHRDNVAPSLLGGAVLTSGTKALSLQLPQELALVVVLPQQEIKTKDARSLLSADCRLEQHAEQSSRLARFVIACERADVSLLEGCIRDEIVEPQRRFLLPGFSRVKNAALAAGAIGCSFSGSGPAMFALSLEEFAAPVAKSMQDAFRVEGLDSRSWSISVQRSEGAQILEGLSSFSTAKNEVES